MSRKVLIQPDHRDWKVILRNDSAQQLVLYNELDQSLQVQETPHIKSKLKKQFTKSTIDNKALQEKNIKICGECKRPWPEYFENEKSGEIDVSTDYSFIDRNYFRLLDISSRQPTLLKYYSLDKDRNHNHQVIQPLNSRSGIENRSKLATNQTSIDDLEDEEDRESASNFFNEHPKNLSDSSINQGYYKRFFKEDIKLGRGSGGSVFKCQHVLDGIELGVYAVKKVPVGDDHSWLNRMLREVHILENLRHTNIIEYKHAWLEYHKLTQFGPSIPCLFILMQLAEGGNLEEFVLSTSPESLDISLYCDWFEQICLGLAHLHRCGILHRDLKPSNILLKSGTDGKIQMIITDFGECTSESGNLNGSDHNRTGATGTIEFVAPELLKLDRKSGQYLYQQSKLTDVWSLGLIFYFMLTQKLPYADIDDIDTLKIAMCSLKQINLPKEANRLPKGFKNALGAMLQVDPDLRPTIEQVLVLLKEDEVNFTTTAPINQISRSRPMVIRHGAPKIGTSKRRLSLTPQHSSQLDENTRISLALLIICLSVIPSYPTLPSLRKIVIAFIFTIAAQKTTRPRSAIILLTMYSILIFAFYYNKIN